MFNCRLLHRNIPCRFAHCKVSTLRDFRSIFWCLLVATSYLRACYYRNASVNSCVHCCGTLFRDQRLTVMHKNQE
uniref:Uncharacterized protein n=1 Tax=Rhizophora mucronata TaxID=61149 RepID=A0A2P2QVJ9_RHIMU